MLSFRESERSGCGGERFLRETQKGDQSLKTNKIGRDSQTKSRQRNKDIKNIEK
jgi:hypothetical protein